MPALHAIIFDLDGTLLDSAPDLRHALNATLADYGRASLKLDTVAGLTGDGLMPLLKRGFAASGAAMGDHESDGVYAKFIEHYRQLEADPAQIYPHVVAFLEKCQSSGILMGICTNKQESETHRLLKQIDLTKFFAFVAGFDTFASHKPHPDHMRGVVKALNVPMDNCVMVGDSRNDILAAHAAGIFCIGISHGYGGSMQGLGADIVVDNFQKLPGALTHLNFTHSV